MVSLSENVMVRADDAIDVTVPPAQPIDKRARSPFSEEVDSSSEEYSVDEITETQTKSTPAKKKSKVEALKGSTDLGDAQRNEAVPDYQTDYAAEEDVIKPREEMETDLDESQGAHKKKKNFKKKKTKATKSKNSKMKEQGDA